MSRMTGWGAFFMVLVLWPAAHAFGGPVAADAVVDWASPSGVTRLEHSQHKTAFFRLAPQFESQTNDAFCGPASSTVVLNALRMDKDAPDKSEDASVLRPGDLDFIPKGRSLVFKRYTQTNFFNTQTDKVKARAEVLGKPRSDKRDGGIQLRQLSGMLQAHGLDSDLHVVADQSADLDLKTNLVQALSDPKAVVIVNFQRGELGQKGGGHISPLGAYDDETDSFLLLDVNPNDHPWVWVKTAALIQAMRTKDTAENRGYLIVRDR